jgi:hypothetical protein
MSGATSYTEFTQWTTEAKNLLFIHNEALLENSTSNIKLLFPLSHTLAPVLIVLTADMKEWSKLQK